MSHAASQASAFYEEVASSGRAFTILEQGNFLIFPIRDREVVPLWSSRVRVKIVQQEHPRYRGFVCDEITLNDLFGKTFPDFQKEGIHVGVNWSGKRLTGYDISVPELIKNVEYWQTRLRK